MVRQISAHKDEPEWMLEFRLKALEDLRIQADAHLGWRPARASKTTLDEIYFYVRPQDRMERSWDDVPDEIKNTFEKLGHPRGRA